VVLEAEAPGVGCGGCGSGWWVRKGSLKISLDKQLSRAYIIYIRQTLPIFKIRGHRQWKRLELSRSNRVLPRIETAPQENSRNLAIQSRSFGCAFRFCSQRSQERSKRWRDTWAPESERMEFWLEPSATQNSESTWKFRNRQTHCLRRNTTRTVPPNCYWYRGQLHPSEVELIRAWIVQSLRRVGVSFTEEFRTRFCR